MEDEEIYDNMPSTEHQLLDEDETMLDIPVEEEEQQEEEEVDQQEAEIEDEKQDEEDGEGVNDLEQENIVEDLDEENIVEENANEDGANAQEGEEEEVAGNHKRKKTDSVPSNNKKSKKGTSKWIVYLSQNRKKAIDENPGLTFPQITKLLAETYKNLSPEELERLDQLVQEANDKRQEADMEDGDEEGGKTHKERSASSLEIPLARVKKCMKLDPEVKNISKDTLLVMTKATELFIARFGLKCQSTIALRGGKSVKLNDVIHTIHYEPSLEFLRSDYPKSLIQTAPEKDKDKEKEKVVKEPRKTSTAANKPAAPATVTAPAQTATLHHFNFKSSS